MSYLFGSINGRAPRRPAGHGRAGAGLVLALVAAFYRGFLVMSFDEEFARSRGVPVDFLYFLLISMVGVSVVMIIRVWSA